MARFALVSVAVLLVLGAVCNAQPMRNVNVMQAIEDYYRARLRQSQPGRGMSRMDNSRMGKEQDWEFEWEQGDGFPEQEFERDFEFEGREREMDNGYYQGQGQGYSRFSQPGRSGNSMEDFQVRLFMNEIRSVARSYSEMCPRLMGLLERGFMRHWLSNYLQRSGSARSGMRGDRERSGEWTSEFSRYLRTRPGESREFLEEREGREGRDSRGWRDEEFGGEAAERQGFQPVLTSDSSHPMWRGLMASCYMYQNIVHGNAPRLESSSALSSSSSSSSGSWGRAAANAQQ